MWYMYASVAKADTGVGCREGHIGAGIHIHAVEQSPAQVAPGIFQRLLAPEVTDRIAADVDRALLRFMSRACIIWSTCVRFERVGQYIEARIGSGHRWQ